MYRTSVRVVGRDRVEARVRRIQARVPEQTRQLAKAAGTLMRDALREEVPVRTGTTRRKISYRAVFKGDTIRLVFRAPWWTHFITKGTEAHTIWAGFFTGKSNKKSLFFAGENVRVAHHPGARANDFVHRAYARSLAPIRFLIRASGAAVMRP